MDRREHLLVGRALTPAGIPNKDIFQAEEVTSGLYEASLPPIHMSIITHCTGLDMNQLVPLLPPTFTLEQLRNSLLKI